MEFSEYQRDPAKKAYGFGIVILVHALVIYALVTGLARKMVEIVKQPIETKIIEEVKPPPPPELEPPPPPPKMTAPPPPFIPPPEVAVATPPTQTIAAVSNVKPDNPTFARPQPPVTAPAQGPSRTNAVVDFSTCAKPDYPRNSQRNEEQGTVTLQFLIGVDGSVKDAKIDKTSGFRELDKAALRGLSQCKFKPAMIDGRTAETWSNVQYVWRLE
jgi:periplasmic protein TonB